MASIKKSLLMHTKEQNRIDQCGIEQQTAGTWTNNANAVKEWNGTNLKTYFGKESSTGSPWSFHCVPVSRFVHVRSLPTICAAFLSLFS